MGTDSRQMPQDRTAREARLLAPLVQAGYRRIEPSILQPAALFLDLSGEDIRGRLFLTSDPSGEEYCLRPEYTIPVCRAYLASPDAGHPASFSYVGPIFRHGAGASPEVRQAGLESFGRGDREAADAEIFTLALEALRRPAGALGVRMGDAGLFDAFLDALKLPLPWVRRIRRGHILGQSLAAILTATGNGQLTDHSGVLAALEGVDRQGARALVQDLLSIAGISAVGGRSASEIAERFLEQAAMKTDQGIGAERRQVLEQFLAVAGDPDTASLRLRSLAQDAGLDLGPVLDAFDARSGFIAARGVDLAAIRFEAAFGRNLDYYTGFVFEARQAGQSVLGGGRYDRLLAKLGATQDIPAVGAAIWCDRLSDQGDRA